MYDSFRNCQICGGVFLKIRNSITASVLYKTINISLFGVVPDFQLIEKGILPICMKSFSKMDKYAFQKTLIIGKLL